MMTDLRFPGDGYKLRKAENDDASFVADCMRESILLSVPDEEAEQSGLWIDDILNAALAAGKEMRSETFILENDSKERKGMLWMGMSKDQFTCEETGYLLGLFVKEELRGKGLGKGLIECAEDWCRKNDTFLLTLNTGSANFPAKKFYECLGYKERSVVMRKRLIDDRTRK
ncbi:MAG: GNAT family N-acetyltransferase [Methanomassiliicoccaceae archaeon]|nr:GNAT family N-acetyltransferase [Methanomassiliicoccaceae archaeon]